MGIIRGKKGRTPAKGRFLFHPRFWLAGAVLVAIMLAFVAVRTIKTYQEDLPSIEQIYNITPILPAKVYDRNGRLFKQFYRERRMLARYDELPQPLIDALLATEDRKFYDHWGFDWTGLARAIVVNIRRGGITQGGSTVTQQLARMLFLTPERTLTRKIKELLTAIKIERTYSKNEILEMYLNLYNFGSGAYGVKSAAQTYFSKDINELDILDCAVLAATFKAPNRYAPLRNPTRAYRRRNVVLASMRDFGKITQEQFDSLRVLPLRIKPATVEYGVGEYFSEEIRRYIEKNYGVSGLYSDGLEIYTTMDFGLQEAAERFIRQSIDSLRASAEAKHTPEKNPEYYLTKIDPETGDTTFVHKKLQAALYALDNKTGDVLVIVGGRSFAESQWNRATQAHRQPGSSFKPFVVTAAIEAGFMPSDTLYDSPIVLSIPGTPEWRPHNFDLKFKGKMTLRAGIADSRNLISIKLLQQIDPKRAIFYAHQMGIRSDLLPVPTLAIGASEVYLSEMVEAYACFPNGGIHTTPRLIKKILDRYGNPLEINAVAQKQEALSAKTAYIVTSVLESVAREGTGKGMRWRGFTRPAGGKTGTTDSYMDNWFMGFTPQITAGVWVGYDLKTPIGGYHTGTGAATALPIWTKFMIAAHDSLPELAFEIPDGVYEKEVCRETGYIATDFCIDTYPEVFLDPADTLNYCPLHRFDVSDHRQQKDNKDRHRTRF